MSDMNLICYSDFCGEPYWNMAVDEWLFERASTSRTSVYLRVYSWAKPCISIGYHQDYKRAIDADLLSGTPVVRRMTGGRGLLHECSELTYAITAPICYDESGNEGAGLEYLSRSLSVSGRLIGESLRDALAVIGVSTEMVKGHPGSEIKGREFHTLPCMASNARFELVSSGRKLVASAQRRLSKAFLQHGAIKITPARQHPALDPVCASQLTVEQQVSGQTFEAFSSAFGLALSQKLGLNVVKSGYSNQEKEELERLRGKISQKPLNKRTILCTQ